MILLFILCVLMYISSGPDVEYKGSATPRPDFKIGSKVNTINTNINSKGKIVKVIKAQISYYYENSPYEVLYKVQIKKGSYINIWDRYLELIK